MRSDLKAVAGITNIQTNLDNQTCSFEIEGEVNVSELIDSLAKNNNKILDWTLAK